MPYRTEYLSADGANPFAPWPGYGWPMGTRCWFFRLVGRGRILFATGHTVEAAFNRALFLATFEEWWDA